MKFKTLLEIFKKKEDEFATPEEKKRKQIIKIGIAGIAFVFFIVLLSAVFGKKPEKKGVKITTPNVPEQPEVVTPTQEIDILREKWIQESSTKFDSIFKAISKLSSDIKKTNERISELEQKIEEVDANYKAYIETGRVPGAGPTYSSPPRTSPQTQMSETSPAVTTPPRRRVITTEEGIKVIRPLNGHNSSYHNDTQNGSNQKGQTIENAAISDTFFLPSGSFAQAVLINGVDAPTGGGGQHPVLMVLTDPFILPNLKRGNFEYCFFVGSAWGDLSSERVYIRLERISFVYGDKVIDAPIKGWVVDTRDGIYGVKGKVVDKQGRLLGYTLLAGFVSGAANAFRYAGTETQITPIGGTIQTVPPEKAFQVAAATGVQSAAERLANFYLSKAQKLFPVVEIKAGTPVHVVIQEGITLVPQKKALIGGEKYESPFNY